MAIDHARDNFLARSTLTADQNRCACLGDLFDRVLDVFHLRTGAEKTAEIRLTAYLVAKLAYFRHKPLLFDGFIDS